MKMTFDELFIVSPTGNISAKNPIYFSDKVFIQGKTFLNDPKITGYDLTKCRDKIFNVEMWEGYAKVVSIE